MYFIIIPGACLFHLHEFCVYYIILCVTFIITLSKSLMFEYILLLYLVHAYFICMCKYVIYCIFNAYK